MIRTPKGMPTDGAFRGKMVRITWKNHPITLDGRGFRPPGQGRRKPCPHCGKNISHGLPGNPHFRKLQPCQAVPDEVH